LALSLLSSCRTVHFDVTVWEEPFEPVDTVYSLKEEEKLDERELKKSSLRKNLKR
jgi:hypothetical protein